MTCPCHLGLERCDCGLVDEPIPTEQQKKVASGFADLEGEHVERWDRRMNLAITVVIVMAAAAAIFWPVR